MEWTKAQQKVIDARNKNILVSAAAGSGKTAVLVERIISMISEGDKPLDIDHLLVVTFTNAAAAEMRGRIGEAIDEKLQKQPGNPHLQKQLSLLQSAQIITIHSFCLNVIRNYFHHIDLDPAFKIGEESEMTLMKADVISDLLERWYEEGREDFLLFIESYAHSKSDTPIEELILQLYHFSMSAPWPKRWMEEKKEMFALSSVEEMSKASWMKELLTYINAVLSDLISKNVEALSICRGPGGPSAYEAALLSDQGLLEALQAIDSYEEYGKVISGISFERLSAKKEEGVEPWKKERIKELREEVKKGIKDIGSQFFFQTPEEMLKDIQDVGQIMQVLYELTLEFMEEFRKKKEEKNLIDFNDLEHFALKILVSEEDEAPTVAARELCELYDEILIDEYQDSNMVQETILRSISREASDRPNRFMVGDVKQSIYKFRLAMPEIFMEKYETYSREDEVEGGSNLYQRIDLDCNFRSRRTVLDYVNKIFEQIMQRSVGGIVYDEAASLKYGELFEETLQKDQDVQALPEEISSRIATEVEFLLVTEEELSEGVEKLPEEETEKDSGEEALYTKRNMEAKAIAARIKELTDPEQGMVVFDRKKKKHRPAQLRDVVILLRSISGWSEDFVNTLMEEGIPAYADTGTGYFQTLEIMTILNMLRIIDNPRQDIPLTGVLYSPMVGITTTELALIRAFARNVSMYSAVKAYATEGDNEELRLKLLRFDELLNSFRSQVNHKPIHELIHAILEETGYYYYISAMPGGERRKANVDMLISRAVRFEKGSYSGLFHFIRYIEKLNKYEVDFGEASTSGEQDNTVRIMSIHKSKGLEFPIVFVAGMSKQFNNQDMRSSIVLHNELGIGPEYIDSKERTKAPTLLKKVIQKKVQMENLGEELRVLYVAMTRAKEKLILSGYLKSLEAIKGRSFSFYEIMSAKRYLDWVLPATINRIGWTPDRDNMLLSYCKDEVLIRVISKEKLLSQELSKQIFHWKDKEALLSMNTETVYDQIIKDEIHHRLQFIYPYGKEADLKVKMTVTELKKLGQYEPEEGAANLIEKSSQQTTVDRGEAEQNRTVPNFISQKEKVLSGTDRGTLYHKVLELLDLKRAVDEEELLTELERMVRENLIGREDLDRLRKDYIKSFVRSNIAERMRLADRQHKLYKEKQFVMGIPAAEVMPDSESKELILIQGIIDVFFEEEGDLVLLDYKSDLVTDGEQLVKRYKVQLNYYRRALEQMLKKKVKEMIIFSLPLGKEIRIEDGQTGTL